MKWPFEREENENKLKKTMSLVLPAVDIGESEGRGEVDGNVDKIYLC